MSLERAVADFVADTGERRFDDLAASVARMQYRRLPGYRRLWEARGLHPHDLAEWRQVPPIPCSAFKQLALVTAPPQITFRSSGTTRGTVRSVHHHPYPDLYRLVIEHSFPAACLPSDLGNPPCILSLIPGLETAHDSSLAFMIDHVIRSYARRSSLRACGPGGVDASQAYRWLDEQAQRSRPVLLLATALALVFLLDWLERRGRRLQLPAKSVIFETGGFKGHEHDVTRQQLLQRIEHGLGMTTERVVREYGMTELTSQAYSRPFAGGDPDVLYGPRWARFRIVDPVSLCEAPRGEIGVIAVFDLANVGSAAHVVTEDLGRAEEGGGFRLLGRAEGAELRGCSLTVEELLQGA